MPQARFALSRDERAALPSIVRRFPDLAQALDEHVAHLADVFVEKFQGFAVTEAQVDELLSELVDGLLAQARRDTDRTEADTLLDAVVNLITRHVVTRRRPEIVRRLVAVKQN